MSDVAIRVEGLGKQYRIGARQRGYKRFSETVMETLSAPARRIQRLGKPLPPQEIIWALKDVSFEVKQGEVVGIIGRNGAGKSTLLKILSRITEPTVGRADIYGRVGSLLEVGTGFHAELTGRENVYLNGAILGMRKAEIDRKFDEIVAFAEVEQFIDTPVKRYSTGMGVRLAFAVAAHLEPDIMLVDEVLAVGDAKFQRKSLGKMENVARAGRTVLFVSHNMASIQHLCTRSIVLSDGQVTMDGDTTEAIAQYISGVVVESETLDLTQVKHRRGDGRVVITSFGLRNENDKPVEYALSGHTVTLVLGYKVNTDTPLKKVVPSIAIRGMTGNSIILHRSDYTNQTFDGLSEHGEFRCTIFGLPLTASTYLVQGNIDVHGTVSDNLTLGKLQVIESDFFGTGNAGTPSHSPVLVRGDWTHLNSKSAP